MGDLQVALVDGAGDLPGRVELVDGALAVALRERGAHVTRPVWHDPEVDWSAYDLAVVRTTWDYPDRREEFVAWAARAGERTRLLNPPDVLRWNTHKSYLLELEERGAPIVPTAWLGRGDRIDLTALLATRGWKHAVVKPAVGAGSSGLRRVSAEEHPAAAQAHLEQLLEGGDVLIQPYLDAVDRLGELSVVTIEGEPAYAVRKRPAEGDFRVQERHGGRYVPEPLAGDVADLARWIVESSGVVLPFARVDLIEDASGTPQLAELEATEPDLYLRLVPGSAGRLADALLARARS